MAYGTVAQVTALIGKVDAITWDATAIGIAIGMADTIVDKINDEAATAEKALASSFIALAILKQGRANYKMKGVTSDAGSGGKPAITMPADFKVPDIANKLLRPDSIYTFDNTTPSVTGEWD